MGVSGLTSFIKDQKEVPGGAIMINMIEEIKSYMSNNSKQPIICIDFDAFTFSFIWTGQHSGFGMRWNQVLEKLKSFFQALKDAGARLVFFLGGFPVPSKKSTYLSRQNSNYNRFFKKLTDLENTTSKNIDNFTITSYLDKYIIKHLKYIGEWVQALEVESDLELARFAKKEGAMAVLTNDSDFLIFEGDFRLLTIQDLNINQFKTMELSRIKLRKVLDLRQDQMPLFATLCGNDMIISVKLKKFHEKLNIQGAYKFKSIANFVKDTQSQSFQPKDVDLICRLANFSKEEIENSLRSYNVLPQLEQDNDVDPLMKSLRFDEFLHMYAILKGIPITLYNAYENVEKPNFNKSQTQLALWIQRCQFGTLLQHKKLESKDPENDSQLKREVYMKRSHNDGYQLEKIDPEYPPFAVPTLRMLIYRTPDDNLDTERYKLVQWCLSNKLDFKLLVNFECEYVPIIATLCYLVSEAGYAIEEADLFLLTYTAALQNRIPHKLKMLNSVEARPFKLVVTYFEMQNCVVQFFATVGLRQYAIFSPFDGLYFHRLYHDWKAKSHGQKQKELKAISDMRFYAKSDDELNLQLNELTNMMDLKVKI